MPSPVTWYPDGPSVTHIPFPIQDPERPWGNDKCPDCSGFCAGHYKLSLIDVSDEAAIKSVLKPPSTYIKEVFNIKKSVTEEDIRQLAKEVLLPVNEVKIWINHLQSVIENRRRGARKAAATRQSKKKLAVSQASVSESNSVSSY